MTFPTLSSWLPLAFLALATAGCQEPSGTPSERAKARIRPPKFEEPGDVQGGIDFGQDWDDVEGLLGQRGSSGRNQGSAPDTNMPGSWASPPRYGICLASFSQGDHELEGQEYLRRVALLVPDMVEELSLHTDSEGTMVLYGDFTGWRDPEVRETVERLRTVEIQGRRLFPAPIPTEVVPPRDPSTISPLELVSIRLMYPEARTIYTLEVAVWGDFEGGKMSDDRRRKLAESYARSLRDRGHKAWYHHDEGKQMSTVTVGAFDHRAIDASSGIRSAAVERVMAQFPERLLNGEPLMIPVNRNDPGAGTRPQKPLLVEVPRL